MNQSVINTIILQLDYWSIVFFLQKS